VSVVLAVDGGNSKTYVALVRSDGELLGVVRGPHSSPQHLGVDGSLGVLLALREEVGDVRADVAVLLLAGLDFPQEERRLEEAVSALGWAGRVVAGNDTFAVLRAGTERGWGVAIVCGAGINCVGVSPSGEHVRFPALGEISGDWGGGYDLGLAAVWAAARSEDGRGPRTSLERLVPAYFGLETPRDLAEAVHLGRVDQRDVLELPPLLFAAAADDAVAAEIVHRLADEVVTLARATLVRLGLEHEPVEVVLGGGVLQSGDHRLLEAIETGLAGIGPALTMRVASSPPIVGSALLGLDEVGAGREAQQRLRSELGAAVERLETRLEVE
jgi:N-acetylglucosamine kinase-like BadF-type ATPase